MKQKWQLWRLSSRSYWAALISPWALKRACSYLTLERHVDNKIDICRLSICLKSISGWEWLYPEVLSQKSHQDWSVPSSQRAVQEHFTFFDSLTGKGHNRRRNFTLILNGLVSVLLIDLLVLCARIKLHTEKIQFLHHGYLKKSNSLGWASMRNSRCLLCPLETFLLRTAGLTLDVFGPTQSCLGLASWRGSFVMRPVFDLDVFCRLVYLQMIDSFQWQCLSMRRHVLCSFFLAHKFMEAVWRGFLMFCDLGTETKMSIAPSLSQSRFHLQTKAHPLFRQEPHKLGNLWGNEFHLE